MLGDLLLISGEMMLQHVVEVAVQRHFVFADYLHDARNALVELPADINRLAAARIGRRIADKERFVILTSPFSTARILSRRSRNWTFV